MTDCSLSLSDDEEESDDDPVDDDVDVDDNDDVKYISVSIPPEYLSLVTFPI